MSLRPMKKRSGRPPPASTLRGWCEGCKTSGLQLKIVGPQLVLCHRCFDDWYQEWEERVGYPTRTLVQEEHPDPYNPEEEEFWASSFGRDFGDL